MYIGIILSVVSGLAGVVIGSFITYKLQNRLLDRQLAEQRRIASERLRLDLFDRRYKVFEAAREFLTLILQETSEASELGQFNLGTADAEFLFGSDVVDWLAEVRKRAAHLLTTKPLLARAVARFHSRPSPPEDDAELTRDDVELTRLADSKEADLSWLIEQTNALTKVFGPYLGFAHIK